MNTATTGKAALAAIAAAVLLLASCGSDTLAEPPDQSAAEAPAAASATTAAPNDADVTFAQRMTPLQREAAEMSEMADARARSTDVRLLAQEISTVQQSELQSLTALRDTWADEGHEDRMGMQTRMDMDDWGPGAPRMMSRDQMHELGDARGTDFDRMFLEMMIKHHEGVVAMAGVEVEEGGDDTALALAEALIDTREAQIDRMHDLLADR